MFTPTVRELKIANPKNEYSVMTLKKNILPCKQVWKNNPYIKEIIESEMDYHPRFWDPQAWHMADLPMIQGELARRFGVEPYLRSSLGYILEDIYSFLGWNGHKRLVDCSNYLTKQQIAQVLLDNEVVSIGVALFLGLYAIALSRVGLPDR